ncbi:MAG: YCF48-related protein [Bacteroidota bacterium]|nr:YCF48-related protein [Bacteroidota bacterium]
MKVSFKIAFLSLYLFLFNNTIWAQEAWQRISPYPQENKIMQMIRIPETTTLVGVCVNATMLFSDDIGESWEIKINPGGIANPVDLNSVSFSDSQKGFICCSNGMVLKTTNGGLHWDSLRVSSTGLTEIYAIHNGLIITIGKNGSIFISEDGGMHYNEVDSGTESDLKALSFPNDKIGFIISQSGELLKSTDYGLHWETIDTLTISTARDLLFIDENDGYFVGGESGEDVVKKTMDGGVNWENILTDQSYHSYSIVKSDTTLILTGYKWYYKGFVLLSNDDGETWLEPDFPATYFFNDLCLYDENTVLAMGSFGDLIISRDHFQTWEKIYSKKSYNAIDICFIDEQGFMAMDYFGHGGVPSGGILKTIDYGLNWHGSLGGNSMRSVYFYDENLGYACTFDCIYYKTTNGGQYWAEYEIGPWPLSDYRPKDFGFFTQDTGLLCIDLEPVGKIWKTYDGGSNWVEVYDTLGIMLDKVCVVNESTAFAIGDEDYNQNLLIKTNDQGETWYAIELNETTGHLVDIFFLNEQIGFILSSENKLFKTTDGGNSWIKNTIQFDINPKSVFFINDTVGYVSGSSSYRNIIKTTDGGENWFPIEQAWTNGITAMHFFNENHGLIFGNLGLVAKTETGGIVGETAHKSKKTEAELFVFPNPFNDRVYFQHDFGKAKIVFFQIFDVHGDLIRSEKMNLSVINEISWNGCNDFGLSVKNGIYFCRITDGLKSASCTVIKIN